MQLASDINFLSEIKKNNFKFRKIISLPLSVKEVKNVCRITRQSLKGLGEFPISAQGPWLRDKRRLKSQVVSKNGLSGNFFLRLDDF